MLKLYHHISQLVIVLRLVNSAGRISVYGPLNSKLCLNWKLLPTWDITNILPPSFSRSLLQVMDFSSSIYGLRPTRMGHKSERKNPVRNSHYGPRPRLVMGIFFWLNLIAWNSILTTVKNCIESIIYMCNNIWPDFHCIFKFLWQRNYTVHEVCRHRFMFASKLRISCQKYKKNSGLFLPDRMYLSSSKIPSVKEIFRRLSGDKKGLKAISYSILNWTKIDVFL